MWSNPAFAKSESVVSFSVRACPVLAILSRLCLRACPQCQSSFQCVQCRLSHTGSTQGLVMGQTKSVHLESALRQVVSTVTIEKGGGKEKPRFPRTFFWCCAMLTAVPRVILPRLPEQCTEHAYLLHKCLSFSLSLSLCLFFFGKTGSAF